ncbi:DUF3891 family protein [Pelagicoccus albus]|uniref:DUF3891 family protein n=1 Tax=Pelagicoccus albus TaxID=415222 RepID=A0A7X1B9A0_9BACT|nr:DUF3891 family protein [Pelagicoccus albus]MBC2607921.1 DUF3891 family protein [Pelagicoccus albus]
MFITPVGNRWFFTTQADHSVLVGQIASFWGNEEFAVPKPMRSMIIAAAEHDHVWVREDHQVLLKPEGVPFDFANLPYDRHTSLYAEGARQVASRDLYAGFMVSLHGMGIYNYRHGTDDTMIRPRNTPHDAEVIDAYMAGEAAYQKSLQEQLAPEFAPYLEEDTLWTNYHIFQVWDRLGILLSKYQQEDFIIDPAPLDYEGGSTKLAFTRIEENHFRVSPYPFSKPKVSFSFIARWVDQISFDDEEQYRCVLDQTTRIPVTYTFEA